MDSTKDQNEGKVLVGYFLQQYRMICENVSEKDLLTKFRFPEAVKEYRIFFYISNCSHSLYLHPTHPRYRGKLPYY